VELDYAVWNSFVCTELCSLAEILYDEVERHYAWWALKLGDHHYG